MLKGLIESATENDRFGRVIEMKILQSLAHQARGDSTEALTALGSALFMAEPEGYVRLFVDEGRPMKELFQKAIADGVAVDYVSRLLSRFDRERKYIDTIKDPQKSTPVEPLSRRELEVLGLLAKGSTNQEIAEELVIAVTTAKKHVSNIIGKLGVTNRTQAVTRARELKLL
jgi:LuxR family maltose regulon positive regulatory protein